jgi:hypothetical protein
VGALPFTLTRSILAVLLPGLLASAPWLVFCIELWPRLLDLYEKHDVLGNAVLFAIIAVIGTVMEGLGSYSESGWDDEREQEFSVKEHWYAYLAQDATPEPVAHRYLSRLVTAMYFELGMAFSVPIGLAGTLAACLASGVAIDWRVGLTLVLAIIAAPMWFLAHAKDTHKALCVTRRETVARRKAAAAGVPAIPALQR